MPTMALLMRTMMIVEGIGTNNVDDEEGDNGGGHASDGDDEDNDDGGENNNDWDDEEDDYGGDEWQCWG